MRCFPPWKSDACVNRLTELIWQWQRNLRDIADLYGTESSFHAVEEYRRTAGLQSISSACFKAARISALLIDDGLQLDKMHHLDWHKAFVPFVGRILRIERFAEKILDEVRRPLYYFGDAFAWVATTASWISSNLCSKFKFASQVVTTSLDSHYLLWKCNRIWLLERIDLKWTDCLYF